MPNSSSSTARLSLQISHSLVISSPTKDEDRIRIFHLIRPASRVQRSDTRIPLRDLSTNFVTPCNPALNNSTALFTHCLYVALRLQPDAGIYAACWPEYCGIPSNFENVRQSESDHAHPG